MELLALFLPFIKLPHTEAILVLDQLLCQQLLFVGVLSRRDHHICFALEDEGGRFRRSGILGHQNGHVAGGDDGKVAQEPFIGVLAHQGDLPAANAPLEHIGAQIDHSLVKLCIGMADQFLPSPQVLEGHVIRTLAGVMFQHLPHGVIDGEGFRWGVVFVRKEQGLDGVGSRYSAFFFAHGFLSLIS